LPFSFFAKEGTMKKALIPLLTAALGVLGGSALAQTGSGATDPANKSQGSKGAYTKEEKAQARSDRLSETARENKAGNIESGEASGAPPEPGKTYTPEERHDARSQRLEETGKQNKAGTLPKGGESSSK